MTKAFAGKAAVAKSMVLPFASTASGAFGASKAKKPELVSGKAIIDEVAEPEANG